jgi:hypothetical protein
MVVAEVVSAVIGYCVELMVDELATEMAAGGAAGTEKRVVGVIHLVGFMDGAQASFVEGTVVGY